MCAHVTQFLNNFYRSVTGLDLLFIRQGILATGVLVADHGGPRPGNLW